MEVVLNQSEYPREAWEVEACGLLCRQVNGNGGLGLAPAVIAGAVQIGTALLDNSGSVSDKDRARLQANADAFRMAANGDRLAIEYLKYRSGRYGQYDAAAGSEFALRYGTPIGGWATQLAKDDAFRLYNEALNMWGIGIEEAPDGAGGTTSPSTSGSGLVSGIQKLPKVSVTTSPGFLMAAVLGGIILLGSRRR